MKSAVWSGQSIDRFIPPYLRNTFYKNSNAQCKYARNNGIGAYDIVTNGLVLYLPLWALNNGGTNSIQSVDAFRHSCSITGATWGIRGRLLDGGDDKITAPDADVLDITGDITLAAWVNPSTLETVYRTIFSKWQDIGTGLYVYQFSLAVTTGKLFYFHRNAATETNALTSTDAIAINTWSHVGISIASDVLTFSINGVADSGGTQAVTKTRSANTGELKIGTNTALVGSQFLAGTLGDLWIYKRALSAPEMMRNSLATKWRY